MINVFWCCHCVPKFRIVFVPFSSSRRSDEWRWLLWLKFCSCFQHLVNKINLELDWFFKSLFSSSLSSLPGTFASHDHHHENAPNYSDNNSSPNDYRDSASSHRHFNNNGTASPFDCNFYAALADYCSNNHDDIYGHGHSRSFNFPDRDAGTNLHDKQNWVLLQLSLSADLSKNSR